MKMDLADKGWLQNRLIDLGLLLIISILAVPIAGFSFIDEAQEVHPVLPWSAIFGFMIPELFFVGIFGIISLIHHGKTHWRYQNPIKAFFVVILGTFLIYLTMYFVLLTFVPNIHDCIISFYWGAKPCSALDVDGFLSMVFYVYFITPSILFLLMLFIIILKPNNSVGSAEP